MNSVCCVCESPTTDCASMYFGSICRQCVMAANRLNPNDAGARIMLAALRPIKREGRRRRICKTGPRGPYKARDGFYAKAQHDYERTGTDA